MDSAGEFHIESLLDRLEKIHDEMMRDVESAQRQHILVVGPFAFHQLDIEPFLFKKPFFDRGEDRRFASQADIAHAGSCLTSVSVRPFCNRSEQARSEQTQVPCRPPRKLTGYSKQ